METKTPVVKAATERVIKRKCGTQTRIGRGIPEIGDMLKTVCSCQRSKTIVFCRACGYYCNGRLCIPCEIHPRYDLAATLLTANFLTIPEEAHVFDGNNAMQKRTRIAFTKTLAALRERRVYLVPHPPSPGTIRTGAHSPSRWLLHVHSASTAWAVIGRKPMCAARNLEYRHVMYYSSSSTALYRSTA
ncbi:hypothetical protein EVAR_2813_1 [Eumeta japonica]|uniref:Uncharacterized protein n=1 Tax=Eumeta variegata TaxID=151549 RepID=A0A4C1T0M3_EUMVA|nr:hypothetical protein EVAR_2813_1 [Eumeta japonica]